MHIIILIFFLGSSSDYIRNITAGSYQTNTILTAVSAVCSPYAHKTDWEENNIMYGGVV